jgi:hypothetical protein
MVLDLIPTNWFSYGVSPFYAGKMRTSQMKMGAVLKNLPLKRPAVYGKSSSKVEA